MSSYASVLPGSRVRNADGFIGTVERLTDSNDPATNADGTERPPTAMVVRSDDGVWRFLLPLMLVTGVTHKSIGSIVTIALAADQLPQYVLERVQKDRSERIKGANTHGAAASLDTGQPDLRIPLAQEHILVTKKPIQRGVLHVHKGVETVEQRLSVPLLHEEAVIERIPASDYQQQAAQSPNEIIIPVVEERLVVRKESVVKEYIRISKKLVEQRQDIRDTVRREVVRVTENLYDTHETAMTVSHRDSAPTDAHIGADWSMQQQDDSSAPRPA